MEQPKKHRRWLWLLLPTAVIVGMVLHFLDFPHISVDKGDGHLSVSIGNVPEQPVPPMPPHIPDNHNPDLAQSLRDAAPSLVTVIHEAGTELGVVLSENGYIITDATAATPATVRLADGREFSAESVCCDDTSGLAVVKIDAENLIPARFSGAEPIPESSDLGMLGISVNDLPQRANRFFHLPEGAHVVSVQENSDLFGRLFPGDIITALDGAAISDSEALQMALENRLADETVRVTVFRRGEYRTEQAKLVKKP